MGAQPDGTPPAGPPEATSGDQTLDPADWLLDLLGDVDVANGLT
jgi:hypothetical protein